MLSQIINKVEDLSKRDDCLLLISKGELKVIQCCDLKYDSTKTLGEVIDDFEQRLSSQNTEITQLKSNLATALEALNALGACTQSLSQQIEVLNQEVYK